MRKALENLGWDCSDQFDFRECGKCGALISSADHKHCYKCGAKLPKPDLAKDSTVAHLEKSIAYALGETRTMPGDSIDR